MRYFKTQVWRLSSGTVRGVLSNEDSEETPLVFLHGLDGDLDEFHLIWPLLQSRPLLAYDQPGFGPLGRVEPLGIEDMARTAAEIIQLKFGDRPVDVLGTSMGTMVALALAHFHPHLVRKVILLAPAGVWDFEAKLLPLAKTILPLGNAPAILPFISGFSLITHSLQNTPPGWSDWDWIRWQLWRKSQKEFSHRARAYLDTLPRILATDCRPWAKALQKPLLIICGDEDAPHSLRASNVYQEIARDSRLVWIPGGKHMIWMGFFDRIAALVKTFSAESAVFA